jgi:hypothetical protein
MFRKTAFVLATTAALGAAALAPTSASAHHFGHFGHGWGLGAGIAAGIVGTAIVANSCVHREVVRTPYGWRTRWVNVCY